MAQGSDNHARSLKAYPSAEISTPRLQSGPPGCNLSLQAASWASRLQSEPLGYNLSLQAAIWASRLQSEPSGCNLGLQAAIWACRLQSKPAGCNLSVQAAIWASSTLHLQAALWASRLQSELHSQPPGCNLATSASRVQSVSQSTIESEPPAWIAHDVDIIYNTNPQWVGDHRRLIVLARKSPH